ncbi:MAG: hypothetical protein M1480_05330 [Bacteroidetes bacterium]|nr:hypothetical protein [Bacteroidota bacterium]
MKKYLLNFLMIFVLGVTLSFNGCILDALNTLTENIPVSQEFNISSILTSYSQSEIIDLSNSSTYQRYQDKIQSIQFLQAEYRTKSVVPSDLSADVSITLKDNNGNVLFTYPLGQIKLADYQNTPYQLTLNSTQISLINAYLSTLSNKVFVATISITNITSSQLPYNIDGVIDIVFSMKTKT